MFSWEELRKVNEIIEQLRTTSSTKDKISILRSNKDNEMLKKVLFYTYDSNMKYGMQKKNLTSKIKGNIIRTWKEPFEMFDELSKSNINDELKDSVKVYLQSKVPEDLQELIICILLKDLKIKINATTINKVFPNLLYQFGCQLSESIDKVKIKDGDQIFVTRKLNGTRAIFTQNKLYARSGKEIEGFQNIKDEIKQLEVDDITLDGELLRINRKNKIDDEDNFKQSVSIINSKKRTSEQEDQIELVLFDVISTSEFIQGKSKSLYSERRILLNELGLKIKELKLKYIRVTPILYSGTYSKAKVDKMLSISDKRGYEGLIINLDAPYETKRVKTSLKVKSWKYNDLKIIGFEESEEIPDCLGSIIVDYKGFSCGVGSGFTMEERDYIWKHKDEYLGRICTIKCKQESSNKKGELAMNFPIWQGLREEGKEISYES